MIGRTFSSKVSDIIIYSTLAITSLIMIYPFWNVFVGSISQPHLVRQGMIIFVPQGFSLAAYTTIFNTDNFMKVFGNTVFITVAGTLLSMILTVTLSYTLSKKRVIGATTALFLVF